ncbi:hypothetical protein IQ37_04055 [Chryseobacterium piperi]|uniref:Lipoprotein n=1 Tax=Chryseobacterium piperi TaxID=558152 RepID=A0A086BLL9_9FLAO|nr:hypothetical protein [Chryseobacterium piperi]ASW73262.1 hypothetical protein CJF12_02445 [Chryseobacterium piperi]KFF29833.1 hypothetical protein IQ37_04055 [Chryseobacterium piperi]
MNYNLKKIIYFLFLVIGIISCRQEDFASESKNEQKTFSLFNKASYMQNKSTEKNFSLSKYYALDFSKAFNSYDVINNTNHTGLNTKVSDSESYVNFKVHSQVIEDKEGNIYMYFPLMKEQKVIDIYYSKINKENTLLALYKLKNETSQYNNIFSSFEKVFNPSNDKMLSKSGGYHDIEEVVITGPSKPSEGIDVVGPDACSMYGQCNNNGGSSGGSGGSSGGGNTPDTPNTDPCTKGKKVQNSEQVKNKVKDLKSQAQTGEGEKGFKVKADGSTSEMLDGGKHSVDLGDKSGYQGAFHNHTKLGIKILSPSDIDLLLAFARGQGNQGTNVQNAFLGMVGPDGGQYVGWFNGSYDDAIKNFSQEQINVFENDYNTRESELLKLSEYTNDSGATLNNKGLEKLFSDTLKNMGLDGKVKLQKVDPNNNVNTINYDAQGNPTTPTPCP